MKIIRPMVIDDVALASSNVPETDETAWDYSTSYAIGDRVRVVDTDIHRIYVSLEGSNVGNSPLDDDQTNPTHWQLVGATNRWSMFDSSVQSQTENADTIEVEILLDGRADSAVLLNIDAATVRIVMNDPIEGDVYDQTFDMVDNSAVIDWYTYFFEPIERLSELAVTDMPPYSGATVTVTLDNTGGDAKCGELIVGLSRNIGETEKGATVGIQDYSVKTADDFGNYTITERAFAKRANFEVWVPYSTVDSLQKLLTSYRATPVVYIGADEYSSTIVFGFFKDFSINIAYDLMAICTLEIEGLT